MSLINQMLQDLEARHEGDARARLHREVRSLPAQRNNRLFKLAALTLALGGAGTLAAWGFLQWSPSPPPAPAVKVDPAPVPLAAPVPAAAVSMTETALAPPPVLPDTKDIAESLPSALDPNSGLKWSSTLDRLPAEVDRPSSTKRGTPPNADDASGRGGRSAPQGVAADDAAKPPVKPSTPPRAIAGGVEKSVPGGVAKERVDAEYRRAIGLVNGARVTEAVDVLLDVLRQDGGHVGARQLLAKLLIEQRRRDEAAAILAEGLASQPSQTGWAMTLARLQADRGDLAGAAKTLQNSLSFGSSSADYLGFCGLVQHRLGHQRESAEHYQAAARLAPGDGRWWLGLGLAMEADQRAVEAREAFVRARATGSLNADLSALVDQKLR